MKSSCIAIPQIILPVPSVDMQAWAVIACDQHTSDAAYWQELDRFVGDRPSTLRLTLPEIYLKGDVSDKLKAISAAMDSYRRAGIFRELPPGFILTERKTPVSPLRRGVVLAVDLEAYSYDKKSDALIRATEATITERIPPRLKIRESAALEFPHIMLLYDDPQDTVLGPYRSDGSLETVYDFDLNMGGGHIRGRFVQNTEPILEAFGTLVKDNLLFMVGDGNHSLATAKAMWEKIKPQLSAEERKTHPARYALCEAVNLYDEGIRFEAIHRYVRNVDAAKFAEGFARRSGKCGCALYVRGTKSPVCLGSDVRGAVAEADEYIAEYIAKNGGDVDYIHGEDGLRRLTEDNSASVGIALPKMDKADLFPLVKKYGSLPRKTFSMGESEEKRYYIEGRFIVK